MIYPAYIPANFNAVPSCYSMTLHETPSDNVFAVQRVRETDTQIRAVDGAHAYVFRAGWLKLSQMLLFLGENQADDVHHGRRQSC